MANEGADAIRFTRAVLDHCAGVERVTFFAVLDNATTDNSLELLRDFARSESRLKVVWAPENRCVVDAYVRGYREALAAGCEWILEIDAGFSHQPNEIPRFLEKIGQGYDCVFGSRFMRGSSIQDRSFKRYLISRGGTLLTNLLLKTKQTDMTSGFELFTRRALEMVLARSIQSRAHFFQTEVRYYCRNLRWIEVPITYRSPSPRLDRLRSKTPFDNSDDSCEKTARAIVRGLMSSQTALVVTSIAHPNRALHSLAEGCKKAGVSFIRLYG